MVDSVETEVGDFFDRQQRSICRAVKRFPLAICFVLALTIYLIFYQTIIFDLSNWAGPYAYNSEFTQQKSLLILCFGMFCFLLMAIAAEAHRWDVIAHYAFAIAIYLCFCGYIYFSDYSVLASGLLLLAAVFLLIPCAPWLFRPSNNMAFWNFSYHLTVNFGQLLVDTLSQLKYPFFTGLVISILVQPIGEVFGWLAPTLFILIFFLYLPINFLATIPTEFDNPKRQGGKLVNLIILLRGSIYLVFIALFAMSIWLVLFSSFLSTYSLSLILVFGVLCHFANYPIRMKDGMEDWFYQSFYALTVLPAFYLLFAIRTRVEQFGWTEYRYLGVIIGVWLLIITGLFYVQKTKFRLLNLPFTLAMLCLLASIGPWQIGRFPVESQFKRLENMLTADGLLINGKYQPPASTLDAQPNATEREKLVELIRYLANDDLIEHVKPWFFDRTAFILALKCDWPEACDSYTKAYKLITYMGLDKTIEPDPAMFGIPPDDTNINTPPPEDATFFTLSYIEANPVTPFGPAGVETFGSANSYIQTTTGFDYVMSFMGELTIENLDTFADVRPPNKTTPRQRILLKNSAPGQIMLTLGRLDSTKLPPRSKQIDGGIIKNLSTPTKLVGKTKQVNLGLQTFLIQLAKRYPKEFAQAHNVYDNPTGISDTLPADKEGRNPLIVEQLGNGLQAKVEMSQISYKVNNKTKQKTFVSFIGTVYLKVIH